MGDSIKCYISSCKIYTVGLITSENYTLPLRGKGNCQCKAYVTLRDGGGSWQVMANIQVVYIWAYKYIKSLFISACQFLK